MKSVGEGIALGLVILSAFGLIGLIVQYNMINEDVTVYDTQIKFSLESKTAKKERRVSSHLDKFEGHEDIDVKAEQTAVPVVDIVQDINVIIDASM